MLLSDVIDVLHCDELLVLDHDRGRPIADCFAADLMSEVLAFSGHGALLLTGLTNVQSVRTAALADLRAVVYVRGKQPDPQAMELAHEEGLPLLVTRLGMFEACGRLYQHGFGRPGAGER